MWSPSQYKMTEDPGVLPGQDKVKLILAQIMEVIFNRWYIRNMENISVFKTEKRGMLCVLFSVI